MFLHLLLFVSVLWFIVDHLRNKDLLALAKKLPSTKFKAFPLVGHGYLFIGNDEIRMQMFQAIGKEAVENGGITMWWLGRKILLMVSDPEIGDFILKSCLQKGELMKYIRDVTGNGSIFADVHIWRPRRKVMAPAFSPKILKQFTDIFSKQSKIMVQQLQKVSGMGDFGMWKYLVAYSMDAVCETNLGVEISAQTSPDEHEFIEWFDKGAKIIAQRIVQPWLKIELIFKLSPYFKNIIKCKKILYGFIEKIIKNKRLELEDSKNKKLNNVTDGEPKRFKTFLEMLIENSGGSKGYTDVELREETLVIAMAGTDTSAVGSCFTLSMLAKHPDVQDKVYKEIRDVFGASDRAVTYEDLPRLKYLDAAIKESLRLYTPVPVIVREIEKEITLPTGETLLPGVEVMINIWAIHRNPKYWGEDAELFRPERFFDTKLAHPAAFMPFSHGPRSCIGYQYAMMSMKIAVASIMRTYSIMRSSKVTNLETPTTPFSKSPENERVKFDVMMKDINNFTMRLDNRNEN